MGIAAYNRGSMVIRRYFDRSRSAHISDVINILNTYPRGSCRPHSDCCVIRFDNRGKPWLMNRADRGWGEFGFRYDSVRALFATWDVWVIDLCRDEHSLYYTLEVGHGTKQTA